MFQSYIISSIVDIFACEETDAEHLTNPISVAWSMTSLQDFHTRVGKRETNHADVTFDNASFSKSELACFVG